MLSSLGSMQSMFKYANSGPVVASTHQQIDTLLASASLWFDAKDLSTLYDGAVNITGASGQAITQWNNKGTANVSFLTSGPIVYNSGKGIETDSTTAYMYINNPSLIYNNNSTILVLYQPANPTYNGFQCYFNYGSSQETTHGNEVNMILNYGSGPNVGYMQINSYYNYVLTDNSNTYQNPFITTLIRQQAANGLSYAYANSYSYTIKNAVSYNWDIGTTNYMSLFAHTTGTIYGSIPPSHISEVIMINRVLSSTERELLESYLAWKWGIQQYLNPSNQYASSNPY